jgi:hypothetical protein
VTGDGCADGTGSELVVVSTPAPDARGASTAGEEAATGAMGGSVAGGAVAAAGVVSSGTEGAEVATGGAAGGAGAVSGAVSAGTAGGGSEVANDGAAGGGTEAAPAGAGSVGADALAPASVPGPAVAPGEPPYTCIESAPWSKSSTEPASGAGGFAEGPDRMEAPALPDGARFCAQTAPGTATPSVTVAAIKMLRHRCDESAASALLALTTVLLGRYFGADLVIQLEHASLRIPRKSNPDYLDPFAFQGNLSGRFHLVEVRQEAGRFGRHREIAVLDNRAATQVGAVHVIAVHVKNGVRRFYFHGFSIV